MPAAAWLVCAVSLAAGGAPSQFILLNTAPSVEADAFAYITRELRPPTNAPVQIGVAAIFSYLHGSRAEVTAHLREFLARARETRIPVLVQLDGENWWGGRPDLWNWWDKARPGYSPANRGNVEWTNWTEEAAIKIAWRNWGAQIRVLPPPNLMSRKYRAACHQEMRSLLPVILSWWQALPDADKHLLVGVKLGWESSIGVNAWYYPGGNALLDQPASADPQSGLKAEELPARGVAQIGYAAVKTAGIRSGGDLTEADLAEVTRRHLEDLCRLAAELGMPRDKLFTHVAGWKEKELLYAAALNAYGCPGWSFYQHAADPAQDEGVREALERSDAPGWAAVEWLFQGPRQTEPWRRALTATLADPKCRFVTIYNWQGIRQDEPVLQALKEMAHLTNKLCTVKAPRD